MAQNYLPAIKDGDKRVPVVDGEPVPYCPARIPQGGETRGNGRRWRSWRAASFDRQRLGNCTSHGPTLKAKGLILSVWISAGDRLTEINVTTQPVFVKSKRSSRFDYRYADDAIEARLQK